MRQKLPTPDATRKKTADRLSLTRKRTDGLLFFPAGRRFFREFYCLFFDRLKVSEPMSRPFFFDEMKKPGPVTAITRPDAAAHFSGTGPKDAPCVQFRHLTAPHSRNQTFLKNGRSRFLLAGSFLLTGPAGEKRSEREKCLQAKEKGRAPPPAVPLFISLFKGVCCFTFALTKKPNEKKREDL